jgi:hypothetical protein
MVLAMGLTGPTAWPAGPKSPANRAAPSPTLGLLGAVMAGLCAAGLGFVAAANQTPGLPAPVPWPIVLAALLGTPPLIGALGAVSGRRSLLFAAGILCLVQSILAFSGVTLVFLVPALVFLRAASTPTSTTREPVRPIRLIALVALAIPVALLAVLNLGIFGIVGLVGLAALVPALNRTAPRVDPREALIGIAVIGLVLAAMYTTFANTEMICWNARSTPTGIVYERIPAQESGVISADSGIVSSGCAGGQPTIEGLALTGVFLVGAIAIAVQAARGAERQPT